MTSRLRSVVLAFVLTGLAAAPLAAQGVELGVDLGLGYNADSEVFEITAPASFRFGFPVGRSMTIEPRTALSYASGNGTSLMTLELQSAIMFPFTGDRRRGGYIAALPGVSLVKFEEDALGIDVSDTQFLLGGGVGVRLPQSEQFGLRLEAQVVHAFESDALAGSTAIRGLFGVSFWTR